MYVLVRMSLEAGRKASAARTFGLLGLIFSLGSPMLVILIIPFLAATGHFMDFQPAGAGFMGIMTMCGFILGVVALRKWNEAKRLLEPSFVDPAALIKATVGIVLGWISVTMFVFLFIVGILNGLVRYPPTGP